MLKCCYAVLEVKAKERELTVMFRPKLPASVDTNTAGKYPQVSWKNQMFSHLEMLKSRHKQRCLVWLPSRWTSSSPRHSNQNISIKCESHAVQKCQFGLYDNHKRRYFTAETCPLRLWSMCITSSTYQLSIFTKICNNKISIYRVQKKTVTPAR